MTKLEPINVVATYNNGSVKLEPAQETENSKEETLGILPDTQFQNGEITLEVNGKPMEGAFAGARGFIGIAFRLNNLNYEAIYLRPTNGRSEDQLRRNHSTQYISHPEWPWQRLRKDTPGVYESYVDLAPGEWTRMRVIVCGSQAKLFVHNSEQPTLIVNDLKLGATASGNVGLWIGPGTSGQFRNVKITKRDDCTR